MIGLKKRLPEEATTLDRLRLNYDLIAIETQQKESTNKNGSLQLLQNDLTSLVNKMRSLKNQKISDASLQVYRLEYEKKLVLPSACFLFALLALPLGIGSKRAGRAAGFGIALLLSVIYWALLFLGQTLGYRQNTNPVISMWMPNFVMLLATCSLWIVRKIKLGISYDAEKENRAKHSSTEISKSASDSIFTDNSVESLVEKVFIWTIEELYFFRLWYLLQNSFSLFMEISCSECPFLGYCLLDWPRNY